MKRIVLWFLSTLSVVVLLFGYRTSTQGALSSGGQTVSTTPSTGSDSSGSSSSGASSGSTSSGGSSGSGSGSGSGGSTSGSSKTVTGSVAQTRWGPVQVQITVKSGKITKVSVVQYPNENRRDQEINANALPILVQETIDQQSAGIDMVSGATVTSNGYIESLQSALDQAGL